MGENFMVDCDLILPDHARGEHLSRFKSAPRLLPPPSEVHVAKRSSSKRELIDTGRNKMYGRRDEKGQFKEMDDVGRSLSADRRQHAKTKAPKGQGDRGDGDR